MNEYDLYSRVGLALAIGVMVGFERGWHSRDESEGQRVAGVRTFALLGLLGGVIGALSDDLGEPFVALAFLAVAALIFIAYLGRLRVSPDVGMTTQVAAIATLALGLLAVLDDMALAAAAGVVMTALLASKAILHRWIAQIDRLELNAAIQLLVISVVLLPVLPDRGFGPGESINPYALWWIVVLLAALSFLAYVAVRIAGPDRGLLVTAVLGGLASSTAITLHLSRLARRDAALAPTATAGVIAASAMMLVRILVIVGILNRALLLPLLWPLGLMALVAGALVVLLVRRHPPGEAKATSEALSNPLELGPALGFALFLGVVVVLGNVLSDWLGDTGLYALAATAGLGDVDAVTVLMTQMSAGGLSLTVAVTAIAIAAFVNTAVKGVIAGSIAGGVMARRIALCLAAVLVAGGAGLLLA